MRSNSIMNSLEILQGVVIIRNYMINSISSSFPAEIADPPIPL
jgi:hypothetical protein